MIFPVIIINWLRGGPNDPRAQLEGASRDPTRFARRHSHINIVLPLQLNSQCHCLCLYRGFLIRQGKLSSY